MFAQDVQSQVGDLFTWAALGSLSVATAAAWMIPNVIGYLVGAKFDPYRNGWVSFRPWLCRSRSPPTQSTQAKGNGSLPSSMAS
jgi:hypothetical protein